MPHRRYEVHGTDDLGDVHSYHTDDADRAQGMLETMREDLQSVEMKDHG